MALLERGTLPEKRVGRERLSVSDPLVSSAVAAIDFDGFNVANTTRWGNSLQASARLWMQRGGFGERGVITKGDAARLFAQAFPASVRAKPQPVNHLAAFGRGRLR